MSAATSHAALWRCPCQNEHATLGFPAALTCSGIMSVFFMQAGRRLA